MNPSARLCAYGLYAPLNEGWLREQGVHEVLGPEAEGDWWRSSTPNSQLPTPNPRLRRSPLRSARALRGLRSFLPTATGLPPLHRYASLQMPDGIRRVAGSTDATRGCKHLCRHCPIVPVYAGQFRVVPVDVVIEDIRAQVAAGAQHISFGDPDFLNGPTHARRVLDRVASEFPGLTYDVTIKVEHLLKHREMLPLLRDTGCLFITSAVESIDDARARTTGERAHAGGLSRRGGIVPRGRVTLVPTFVPFTPWTTLEGYVELLEVSRGSSWSSTWRRSSSRSDCS